MKKAAAWALCVLWMMVIFMMSEMSGDVSGAQSGFVTELVERALAFVLGAQTAARIPTDTLELVIRKGAHMGEYAILFWLWAHALGLSGAKRPAVTALAVVVLPMPISPVTSMRPATSFTSAFPTGAAQAPSM